ncbi:Uncharacterized protein TCM_012579 [Theobroma cacao]|uniref:Uncharacterized protein n=1 Tax=Theobroma cacao TaxID=3641 RepID=A0A061FVF6_THECC|nr:Uncharacterized protein TCM_012579 [Theobroma cacao]
MLTMIFCVFCATQSLSLAIICLLNVKKHGKYGQGGVKCGVWFGYPLEMLEGYAMFGMDANWGVRIKEPGG